MRSRLLGLALGASVVAAAPSCATRQSVESLQRQVAQLQSQNFELRKQLTEARVRQQMQAERRAAPPDADGTDEEVAVEIPLPRPGARGGPADVIYSEPITDASRYTSGPLGAQPAARPADARGAAARTGTPLGLMDGARQALDAKDPQTAMSLFQRVVTEFAGDALADDAQFGIGECYFQMERYDEAIAAYDRVGELFPYGDQLPAALLKTGFAQLALHRRPDALATFRRVSETYPGTEAATVARQQMAHLRAGDR